MECTKCKVMIPDGEERTHKKELLCEDCYIDVLSPANFRPVRVGLRCQFEI